MPQTKLEPLNEKKKKKKKKQGKKEKGILNDCLA